MLPETVTQRRRVSQPERVDGRRRDAPIGELIPNSGVGCRKLGAKPGSGSLVHFQQRLALGCVGPLLVGGFHLRQRHAEPLRQQPDRVLESDLLVKLEELEHVSANATAVAIEEALVAVHLERRRLLRVKRAESLVVGPGLFQRDVVLNHRDDVRLVLQVVYEMLRKQSHFKVKGQRSKVKGEVKG